VEAEVEAGEGINPLFWVVVGIALVIFAAVVIRRQVRRVELGRTKIDEAWKKVDKALSERIAALDAMEQALGRAGLVPEARPRLRQAGEALQTNRPQGPRALAEISDQIEGTLAQIYRALPRERLEDLRQAQNRLAQADEELDLVGSQYNELVFLWIKLVQRFPYRLIARRKNLTYPEPFLLPEEDEDFIRRRLTP